jgi:hypothetical protein
MLTEPTEPGFYWLRASGDGRPDLVAWRDEDGCWWLPGNDYTHVGTELFGRTRPRFDRIERAPDPSWRREPAKHHEPGPGC